MTFIKMKHKIDPLVEWAVWGHLASTNNLELVLLKGHLLLEMVIDATLRRNNITENDKHSFYRKIIELEKVNGIDPDKKDFIISSLREINILRNKIAHEFDFDVKNGELESWSKNILDNLSGTKWTKYTYRTKIAHSFSIIAINILSLSHRNSNELITP